MNHQISLQKRFIFTILFILGVKDMSTIAVREETKKELLKFVSELQIKLGRRVDFDEAIRFLLMYRRKRNPRLLLEACVATKNVEDAIKELYEERKKDERRYSRYFSL
ncbi:MAG: hypothetical protein DRO67_10630 [Candidatus Asgardarchaeum californiense]|nr:MAG: hypothetical protein DRO67_10630 [Candidatus Asgardarchaeum californiense]